MICDEGCIDVQFNDAVPTMSGSITFVLILKQLLLNNTEITQDALIGALYFDNNSSMYICGGFSQYNGDDFSIELFQADIAFGAMY